MQVANNAVAAAIAVKSFFIALRFPKVIETKLKRMNVS
jgi:hypothetical protein